MITIHAWNRSTNCVETVDPQALGKKREELLAAHEVLWIDLDSPTPEEEQLVFAKFLPVHPLSLEDITRLRREPEALPHFPKVEEFPEYLFVIVNPLTKEFLQHMDKPEGVTATPDKSNTQLSAVLTKDILVTHHYEPLDCIGHLQTFLKRHQAQVSRGPDFMFHLILDHTVDQYAPVLDFLDDGLDDLELQVVKSPKPGLFTTLVRLKREIIMLRKTLIYEREVLVRLSRGEFALVEERETVYYRNVYDHLVRFTELIESSREMVSDLMQTYLAATSNKLNEIMKVLTMISTIVLPMTLVAGVYGMNFDEMPEIKWKYGYPFALLLMGLTAVGSLLLFRWRKWL